MKLSLSANNKVQTWSLQLQNQSQLPTLFKKDLDKSPPTTQHSSNVTAHEVCYNSENSNCQCIRCIWSLSTLGTPEQWLEFQNMLKLIISGNAIDAFTTQFNLTCLLLEGDARHMFQAKATKLGDEMVANHMLCLQAMMSHAFPREAL